MTETKEHTKAKKIKNLTDLRDRINVARNGSMDHNGDWAAMTVIYPLACEINEILTTPGSFESKQEILKTNVLISWLNDKIHTLREKKHKQLYSNNFYEAKRKMTKHGFIPSDDFLPSTIEELRHKYILEYICSAVIKYLMHSKNMLDQIPALRSKHKKFLDYMQYINDGLDELGTVFFQDEVHMYLLQCSISALLMNKKRSVFSAGKWHKDLAREIMAKRIIELIYFHFHDRKVTTEFVVDVSVSVASHFFFPPMEHKDLEKIVDDIKQSAYNKQTLLNKTIKDRLYDYANERSILTKFNEIF